VRVVFVLLGACSVSVAALAQNAGRVPLPAAAPVSVEAPRAPTSTAPFPETGTAVPLPGPTLSPTVPGIAVVRSASDPLDTIILAQNDQASESDAAEADDAAAREVFADVSPSGAQGQAGAIVRSALLPRAEAFAHEALALQNAVLRHCHVPSESSRQAMGRAFERAVQRVASLVLGTFGSATAETAPARLLTPVADTAFSRSRLIAFVTVGAQPPRTLAALRREDVALQGLPALEAVMLEGVVPDRVPLARRCPVAVVIAAAIRQAADELVRTWRAGPVAGHWRGDGPELADRLRLRDLVQGMIRAVVRLNRDMSLLVENPRRNPELPFAGRRAMMLHLDALARGLVRQADLVRRAGGLDEEAVALLSSTITALEEGRLALRGEFPEEAVAALPPFRRVQNAVLNRLPVALASDTAAFQYPPAAVAEEIN